MPRTAVTALKTFSNNPQCDYAHLTLPNQRVLWASSQFKTSEHYFTSKEGYEPAGRLPIPARVASCVTNWQVQEGASQTPTEDVSDTTHSAALSNRRRHVGGLLNHRMVKEKSHFLLCPCSEVRIWRVMHLVWWLPFQWPVSDTHLFTASSLLIFKAFNYRSCLYSHLLHTPLHK